MVVIDSSTIAKKQTSTHNNTTASTTTGKNSSGNNDSIGMYKKKKYNDTFLHTMATKLHWTSRPSRFVPHGLTGIFVVILGFYLSVCSICGYLGPYGLGPNKVYYTITVFQKYEIKYVLYTFLLLCFINGSTGYILAPTSTKIGKPIFRVAGITVICLVYYSIRFLPETYITINAIVPTLLRLFDIVFCILIVGTTLSFWYTSYTIYAESKANSIAILIGSIGMSTFSAYPIQLLLFGNELLYPLQGVAMTAFVYIPSITVFSLCSFLPTLYLRKMITDIQLGTSIAVLVIGILFVAITSQELIVPDVSTQKLYIPCIVPTMEHSPIEYQMMDFFDVSKLTRSFLKNIWGISVPPPMYTKF